MAEDLHIPPHIIEATIIHVSGARAGVAGTDNRALEEKGIALCKAAMKNIEARLQRNPELPTWDILMQPACAV